MNHVQAQNGASPRTKASAMAIPRLSDRSGSWLSRGRALELWAEGAPQDRLVVDVTGARGVAAAGAPPDLVSGAQRHCRSDPADSL